MEDRQGSDGDIMHDLALGQFSRKAPDAKHRNGHLPTSIKRRVRKNNDKGKLCRKLWRVELGNNHTSGLFRRRS